MDPRGVTVLAAVALVAASVCLAAGVLATVRLSATASSPARPGRVVGGGPPALPGAVPLTYRSGTAVGVEPIMAGAALPMRLATTSAVTIVSSQPAGCTDAATCAGAGAGAGAGLVGPRYNPGASGAYTPLGITEALTFGTGGGAVQGQVALDTVTLQTVRVVDVTGCPRPGSRAVPAPPLTLFSFQFIDITSDTASPDQFGMGPGLLQADSSATTVALRAAFPTRVYVSSVLEALRSSGQPVRWSALLRPPASMMWLGATQPPAECVLGTADSRPARAPLLPSLPRAATVDYRDPGRFYAVRVLGAAAIAPNGVRTPIAFSGAAVIALGVPDVQVPPGPLAAALRTASSASPVGLRLELETGDALLVPPGLSYVPETGAGIYSVMTPAAAQALSSSADVLVLGAAAFMHCLVTFDVQGAAVAVTRVTDL
jgi:hypothetical protein